MIGVPANRARNVHGDLVEEEQQRGELVGYVFGGVEVARVDKVVNARMGGSIGEIEFVRANGHGFESDTEHLRFARIDHPVVFLFEDLVERIFQTRAQPITVARYILQAIRDPDIAEHFVIERFADLLRYLTARLHVVDPESARLRIGGRERKFVVHLGMTEDGGVEIDAIAVLFGPLDPRFEVGIRDLVAIDPGVFVGEDGIRGVQRDALRAGHHAHRFFEVCFQLFEVARATRVVAGGLNTARKAAFLVEAEHVVALPAVNRDGLLGQLVHRGFNVDAELGVLLLCAFKHRGHDGDPFWC